MSPPHSLYHVLSDSVDSGVFIDTKFYLFSRRASSGKVVRPRPLYANSQSLKSVRYFDALLSGGFAEGATRSLDDELFEISDQAEDYDYGSDSDLEDDGEAVEPATKTHDPAVGNQNSKVAAGNRNELAHQGRVVTLRGVSYLTFQAVVMYLYTDEIDFAPFGSRVNREQRIPEFASGDADIIPRPSPKSIYRIADMYDMPKLKDIAFESIRNGIKSCDAIEETFSKFTSRYPEIIDLHARNLASVLLSQDSQDVQERLNEKLQSFTNGQIPHAAHAFSTLLGILARYRASDQPPDVDSPNLQAKLTCTWVVGGSCKISPHRRFMNTALIRSMHHGSFLDMEYRVRKRRAGADQFAPIYISSTILLSRGIGSKLDALAHTYNTDAGQGGHEIDSDSDYEEEPATSPMEARTDGSAVKGNIPSPTSLPGAFVTWKSLFLCLCFNEITFGPLKSQGTSSSDSSGTKTVGGTPACSPKSVYRIAQLLGLKILAKIALRDITGKLTSENIVVEAFSRFTACNDGLIEEQCSLLTSTLKTPETTAALQRCVQEVACGASPHCYNALKLTFGNTINAIKQERQKIANEQKVREDAEKEAARREELMSQPMLKCTRVGSRGGSCGVVSIHDAKHGTRCSCTRLLVCSACNRVWGGTDICESCHEAFR